MEGIKVMPSRAQLHAADRLDVVDAIVKAGGFTQVMLEQCRMILIGSTSMAVGLM